MSIAQHEVYYLKEQKGLKYSEIAEELQRANSGALSTDYKYAVAFLKGKKESLSGAGYQTLLAEVNGHEEVAGETNKKIRSPYSAQSLH